jgi:hypothetical protein
VLRHRGDALDTVRKVEDARLSGKERRFIKGQKYALLAHRENLTLEDRESLKLLLAADKRLSTVYLLNESSASSGATTGRPGPAASSRNREHRSSGNGSSPSRSSLR